MSYDPKEIRSASLINRSDALVLIDMLCGLRLRRNPLRTGSTSFILVTEDSGMVVARVEG